MRRSIVFPILLCCVRVATAQFTNYWQQYTSNASANYQCLIVQNQQDFERGLQSAGWQSSRALPIDWSTDVAAIVAPDHFYKGYNLLFLGIIWNGDAQSHFLNYGWKRQEQASSPSSRPGSITGGGPPPSLEAAVISFRRDMLKPHFTCN